MTWWRVTEYTFMVSSLQQVPRAFYRASRASRRHHWNATNLWVLKCVAGVELIRGVSGLCLGPEASWILSFLRLPETLSHKPWKTAAVRTWWYAAPGNGVRSACRFTLYSIPGAHHPGPSCPWKWLYLGAEELVLLRGWSSPCWRPRWGFAV